MVLIDCFYPVTSLPALCRDEPGIVLPDDDSNERMNSKLIPMVLLGFGNTTHIPLGHYSQFKLCILLSPSFPR